MSINGSISVNALFHDTDGTASLKIVSLKSSDEYTTGKVAVVSGTAGTVTVSVDAVAGTAYKDSSGNVVSFAAVRRLAFSAVGSPATCTDSNGVTILSANGRAAVSDTFGFDDAIGIQTTAGTASYTLVLYGT